MKAARLQASNFGGTLIPIFQLRTNKSLIIAAASSESGSLRKMTKGDPYVSSCEGARSKARTRHSLEDSRDELFVPQKAHVSRKKHRNRFDKGNLWDDTDQFLTPIDGRKERLEQRSKQYAYPRTSGKRRNRDNIPSENDSDSEEEDASDGGWVRRTPAEREAEESKAKEPSPPVNQSESTPCVIL